MTIFTLLLSLFPQVVPGAPVPTASAHNLDASAVYVYFDPDTQAYLDGLIALGSAPGGRAVGTPLLQPGDELGIIIKAIPLDGTTTGVGGYTTFYIPNGVQVVDAAYIMPGDLNADGITGFDKVPMKGQAQMPIVGAGGDSTVSLVGYSPPDIGYGAATNILGQSSTYVNASNGNLGTVVGVYGDTGIFYSTAPETAFGTYSGGAITNNSGDTVGARTILGTTLNLWDAWQMAAYGIKGTTNPNYPSAAIIDSNQRGYAPWGLANVVAGPQSGYAWGFDGNAYAGGNLKAPVTAANFTAAIKVGPWQRIKYPGSQISDDPPGGSPNPPYPQPYTRGADGSNVGWPLATYGLTGANTPLPQTTGQANGTPVAVRWAYGQQVQNRPEYMWIKIKVFDNTAILDNTGCPKWTVDTFGGDAGGDSGGKDHIWRYYDPNSVELNGCLAVGKPATRELVKVGDNYQYKVKLYNAGSKNYSTVSIQDTLPAGVTYVSAVPAPNPNVSLPNLTWTVSPFMMSQMFEATVTVSAKSSGPISNNVCAAGTPAGGGAVENSCGEDITISGPQPLLRQSKSVTPSSVAPGGSVQYTVNVLNVGSGPTGSPVVITEFLPTGFTYSGGLSTTVNGASVTASVSGPTSQPIFSVPSVINAGGSLVLKFNALVSASITAGNYCNSYRVSEGGINQVTGALACVNVGAGTIGDTIWRDWNGNGTQDTGEEGLPGVSVTLKAGTCPGGATVATATTDASGKYLFPGLTTSPSTTTDYCVDVSPPAGYALTTSPEPRTVALDYNETDLTADFGYQPGGAGAIGDTVFEDIGNDGQFDPQGGDTGIPNVQVCLYVDKNNDGKLTPGTDLPVTGKGTTGADTNCVLTDANGVYQFTGLAEGINYLANVTTPQAALTTHFGADPYQASTADPQRVQNLTGTYDAADFGFFRVLPSSIGDTVFVDNDNSGTYTVGDTPIPNVTVELYRNGALLKTAITDAEGKYLFDMLGPGDYTVKVVTTDPDIPTGYAPTVSQYDLTLAPSTNILTADFPFVQRIQKQVDLTQAQAGDALNYTINVQYPGSELLSNVVVTDTVPAGTVYAGNASPTPAIQPSIGATGVISWSIGSNVEARDGSVVPAVTLVGGQDTYINQDQPTDTYGSSTTLAVNGNVSGTKRERPLIQFDLTSVCPGAIQSAQLVLVRTDGGGNADAQAVTVHRVTQTWNAATATWTSFGAAGYAMAGSDPTVTVTGNSGDVPYTWNVTDIVRSWCQIATPNANDGFILTSALDNNKIHLFYSMEGAPGLTPKLKINGGGPEFGTPAHVTTSLGGNDALNPAVVYDSNGVAHTVFEGKVSTTDSKINIYYSNDQGTGTWTTPVRINPAEPPFDSNDSLHPHIAVDSGNSLHVVFSTMGSTDSKINVYAVKGTKGVGNTWTWGAAAKVTNNLGGNDSLLPDIAVDSTGISHVVFEGKGSSDSKINIYYSRDGGTGTWTTPVKITAKPPFDANDALNPRITVGPGDSLHVAFQSKATGDATINVYYIKANKVGSAWSFGAAANVSKNFGGQNSTVPDIAVDSAGVAHIVFQGKGSGDSRINIYYANNKAGTWSTPKKVTLKPPFDAQDSLAPELAVGADGTVHVVFQGRTAFDSKINVYYNTITNGTIGTATSVSKDTSGQDALTPDVAVSSTKVMVVFQGKTGSDKDIFASSVLLATDQGNLTNHLQASPTLAGNGATITVLQTLTADSAVTSITPGALSFTGVNGASVTGCSAASLVSADANLDGAAADSVVYKWTCTAVTTGITALPNASVTFKATASGNAGATAFAESKSNSVLETPPLKFRVTVNTPATINPVVNTAYVKSDGVIPLTSAKAETAIGASIGDTVFADINGNGVQDPGDPGLGGVEVCATDGVTTQCATTDGSGNYRIFGLDETKNHTVSLTPATVPAGYQPTTPSSLSVTSAQLTTTPYYSDADFGLRPPGTASIGDTVWLDANNNGSLDGAETGLPNITVKLYIDQNNDGAVDGGDTLIQTKTTDASGNYLFSGLHPDDYLVVVDETSAVTSPYDGTTTIAAAMAPTTGTTNPRDVTITTIGQVITDADFGYNWSGSIGDYVWYDTNQDGQPNEPAANGIADATVLLYFDANNNGVLDSSEYSPIRFMDTDANGNYLFDNLPPGNYLVDVYEDSITSDGNRDIVPTTVDVRHVVLAAGQDELTADFGYYEGALVEGNVFWDEDHNGMLDPAEANGTHLLENVTVNIVCYGADGAPGGGDDYSGSMDTGTNGQPDGHFKFLVPPGPCTLSYDTADTAAYPEATTLTSLTFAAQAGEDWHPVFDFGVDNAGKIGNFVWNDADGDGVGPNGHGAAPGTDNSEAGLAGVTVSLYRDNNNDNVLDGGDTFLAAMPTGATGAYLFEGLADGNYVVVVNAATLPTDFGATYDNSGATDGTGQADIASGNTDLTVDFGYKYSPTGGSSTFTIGGRVYDDANNNNNDDGETGFAGVDVTVVCNIGTFVVPTNATGQWFAAGIPPGSTCTVLDADEHDLPRTDYVATETPTTPITVNNDVTGLDFGYHATPASISGTVCEATDGDGICQGGEPGLTPVTVTLHWAGPDGILGTGDDQAFTQSTDTNGNYSFTNLQPGLYQIVETNPTGYISVADRDGGNPDNITVLNLGIGQNLGDQDFEDVRPTSVSGAVFDDLDGDGQQDPGEPGIPGVTVTLTGPSGPQVAVTDGLGNYQFTGLLPGNYTITETDPTGYTSTGDADGPANGDNTIAVTLTSGQNLTDQNFGDEQPGSITGVVFDDLNSNGVQDSGEGPLVGVNVCATPVGGGAALCDQTDGTGAYLIPDVPPGDYIVTETNPAGYVSTTPDNLPVSVHSGEDVTDVDYGDKLLAPSTYTISGTICENVNGNGVCDPSETPLPGVTVKLYDSTGAPVATTTTDANGNYTFGNVAPGNYSVVETDPIGFVSVNDADGGTDNTIAVTVTSANVTDQDFVDSPAPGALTGVVFDDLNNNGQLDAGEPGIPGVTVALSTGPTTLTDASGVYTFTNLTPGNYTITETDLAGYISTGDVDGANDNKIVATVNAGQTTTDQDFGDTQLGVITGTVWNDTNLDGIMDGGEGFLPGVQVCAVPTGSGVPLCATTDANGDYTIPNVPPGGYIVTETDPAGYVSTTPNSVPVTVPSGGTETIDYGDVLPNPALGSINGTVCENVNGNGVCEANEPPLPGVTVELWLVGGGAALYTTTTDANGDYAFPNLPSGSYQVKEVNPPNYTSVNDADGNATPDVISPIVIAGNAVTDQDFIDAPTPGSISGKVCDDLNRDGVCGGGEGPLNGVTVKVYDSAGNLVDTQTTVGGNYIFNNLPPGTYTVVETDPATHQSTGDVYGANDNVIVATVPAGTAVSGQNFADAQKPGAITGVVYDDLNGDGNYDPGEPGLPNVQVCLTPPSGPQVCQTTNAGGQYAFADLTPGNYTVTETDPAGYLSTGDADGSANGNNTIAPITVAAGQTVVERNFFDKLGTTGYLLTKTLNSQESVRINKEISFTIRITNTGQTPITVLPLRDTYSTTFLSYGYGTPVKFAEPASANTDNDGILDWPDLTVSLGKDLGPTESFSVTVYFTAIKDTTGLANNSTINTAAVHDAFAGATPLPSDTASASVQVFLPTGVGVSDFGGVRQGSEVHLTWRTAEEANLAGFNVLRKTGDGEFVVLNSELLFAQNAGANLGATYSFVDAGAPADGATYVLELVKLDGSVEAHAPIAVQP